MTVDVHFNAATVAELHLEMHALLIGHPNRPGTSAITGEASNTAGPIAPDKPASGRTREKNKAAAEQPNISTGEERVDPEADKQDAADEAADTKAATAPMRLTHDSVRVVLGGYVQAFGMAAAQEDGAKLIATPKISEVHYTQAALAKAVIAIAQGIEKNPYKRDLAGDGITAEKLAELKPIVAAAMAVK
jgi:hypothetical protein